jgi:hypothetical protein
VAQRPAWRGLEAHESGARWSALRHLEQRSALRGRAERRAFTGCCGKRRERASPSSRQREEKTHKVAVACAARGADVAAGRQCRCEVAAVAEQLSRTHDTSIWAPFEQRLKLTSGLRYFFIY